MITITTSIGEIEEKRKYERELTGNEHGGEQPCPDKVT